MKSIVRLAVMALLVSLPEFAIATTPPVDVHRELVRYRAVKHGISRALAHNTHRFVSMFLEDPTSPYSDIDGRPSITNELWWHAFIDSLPIDAADKNRAALETLQWQLGLTKARPGIEVAVSESLAKLYRGKEAAASALKAGVDADIFWKARDMNGTLSAVAAGYAVALQLLRDKVNSVQPARYAAMGIKPNVLARYLRQDRPDAISEYDTQYLDDLLRYAINDGHLTIDAKGDRQLPAHFRVARVAAAYADAAGYFTGPTCAGNAPAGQSTMPAIGQLCLIAATDRAVHAWYRQEKHRQTETLRLHRSQHEARHGFFTLVTVVLALADLAAFLEPIEASFVDELASSGELAEADAEFASNRSNRLTCRIEK
jgi:hypothetical protein